jgi:ubiquinone/menaquinone biosynthesis C-methylase UbiE
MRSQVRGRQGDLIVQRIDGSFTMGFDPVLYKKTTRDQWEDAAEAWDRWGPTLETWLGEATDRMLDATGVTTGGRVLDIAAGAGGQGLAAAARTGPTGRVLLTDISPTILRYAAQAARDAGAHHVETQEADGELLDLPEPESFDAVICRLGLIYFPDQRQALARIRHALREGGRIGAIVYSTPDRNAFFSLPVSIIRSRAQLPPPEPGQPGPFSLGGPGVLETLLRDAGFRDVTVETVPAPLLLPSAAECVRFERDSFGALHQMLASVPAEERESVWQEIADALGTFETSDGFAGPCELLVAVGTR